MNNDIVKRLLEEAGFSRTYEPERTRRLIELTVLECARIVKVTEASNDSKGDIISFKQINQIILNHFGIHYDSNQR